MGPVIIPRMRNVHRKTLRHSSRLRFSIGILVIAVGFCPLQAQSPRPPAIQNHEGLRLLVSPENTDPTLRVILPGRPDTDNAIEVIFPEHVTVRKRGQNEGEHLYLWRPGHQDQPPNWRRDGQSLQYERDLGDIHFLARATLEQDGVLFHYEFENRSIVDFEMVYAVTDPRLTSIFHDVRLERTYVHHKHGFDLLAAETPSRLNMPMSAWLPARYLVSFTWPVPAKKVDHRDDGITYYNKSQPVDEPMIATVSNDGKWIVASFTRTTGNVWSNPELTCQHVDPASPLAPSGRAVLEVKMLVFQGSLDQALEKVKSQRDSLK